MGKYIDFMITFKENATPEKLGQEIIRRIICSRLASKKPVVFFISGDSGEGKSYTALKILDIINQHYGIESTEVLNNQLVYLPNEYATKMNDILFSNDRLLKKSRVLFIDEARELLPAKLWYNFINRAIADVNAMSRAVKPICLLIVSQFIKDIDLSVRRTITYYGTCQRPLNVNYNVIFSPYRIWKDERDIENPKLRKRFIRGYVQFPEESRRHLYIVKKLQITLPRKEITDIYEKEMVERKAAIIRRKLEEVLQAIDKELSPRNEKIDYLVNYYLDRPDLLNLWLERTEDGKMKIKKDFDKAHDVTPSERKEFEKRLIEKLVQKGLAK